MDKLEFPDDNFEWIFEILEKHNPDRIPEARAKQKQICKTF
jgi:hypothetical protein